jgi:hypothetical protein
MRGEQNPAVSLFFLDGKMGSSPKGLAMIEGDQTMVQDCCSLSEEAEEGIATPFPKEERAPV